MGEPTDERQALSRIDQHVAGLAATDGTLAAAAIAAMLAEVRRAAGPRVRDRAYKALRESRQRSASEAVRQQIARALDEIEELARPVERAPASPSAAPNPQATDGPSPPSPRAAVTIETMVPGARYRIAQDFVDFDGTPFRAGTVLTFERYSYFPYDGGFTIAFAETGMRLAEIDPRSEPVLANAGNAYFAPVDPDSRLAR